MANEGQVRVTLRKSEIGGTQKQRATLRGLGLRRIGESRVLARTEPILGMIRKVLHLVEVRDETR
jgi:large subunit ribosomal protein L30